MEKVVLKANKRNIGNKSEKKKIRKTGRILGVFYMRNMDTIPIDVSEKDINPLIFTSDTHLISLQLNEQEEHECVIKDIQFDPITDKVVHFDLLGLTTGETFQLEVPVQLHGNPVGVKEGGIIQHIIHKLEIECLPKDIPQHIDIDISNLKLGDAFHVRDLNLENIKMITPEDTVIVAITHPKIEKEPVAAEEIAEGEAAQPELIGKEKEEKEEE
jgi:large subunit ribosomal protein L25